MIRHMCLEKKLKHKNNKQKEKELFSQKHDKLRKKIGDDKSLKRIWLRDNGHSDLLRMAAKIWGCRYWSKYLKYRGIKKNKCTKKYLVQENDELRKKFGDKKALSSHWLRLNGYENHCFRVRKVFGSWNNFLKYRGFKLNKTDDYTKESVIQKNDELRKKFGDKKALSSHWLSRNGYGGHVHRAKHLFGSWNNFLKYRGLKLNQVSKYTKESLLQENRSLCKRFGCKKAICYRWLRNNKFGGHIQRSSKIFGSWTKALNCYIFSYHMTESDMRLKAL